MISRVTKVQLLFSRCVSSASSVVLDFQDIPSPKGLPFFGTTFAMLAKGGAKNLHEYIDFRHKQLGQIFRENVGPISPIFLSDPKDMRTVFASEGKYPVHLLPEAWTFYNDMFKVKRGLFFMDGEDWLQNRKIFNKHLLKGNFEWVEKACEQVSEDLVDRWSHLADNNGVIPELETQLYRWSIDIILSIILGPKQYKIVKDQYNDLVNYLAKNIYLIFKTSAKLQLISAKVACKLGLPAWKNFVKIMDESLKCSNNLVEKLMNVCDESDDGLLSKLKNENISREDIIRTLVDFVIAAGDTTAYTMEWLLYSVGTNRIVQEKFRSFSKPEEANSYLRCIVKESLRLYPVAPFITRILTQTVNIKGFEIPPGTLVILSIYTSGRDHLIFENPNNFFPERWLRDHSNNQVSMQHSTLPFGFGSRSCIGRKVAEMQLQKAMGKIIRNFDLDVLNKDEIKMILKMVAVPSKPLQLKVTKL